MKTMDLCTYDIQCKGMHLLITASQLRITWTTYINMTGHRFVPLSVSFACLAAKRYPGRCLHWHLRATIVCVCQGVVCEADHVGADL